MEMRIPDAKIIAEYERTRNYAHTARAFGLSRQRVWQIVQRQRGIDAHRKRREVQRQQVLTARAAGYRPRDIADMLGLPIRQVYRIK